MNGPLVLCAPRLLEVLKDLPEAESSRIMAAPDSELGLELVRSLTGVAVAFLRANPGPGTPFTLKDWCSMSRVERVAAEAAGRIVLQERQGVPAATSAMSATEAQDLALERFASGAGVP